MLPRDARIGAMPAADATMAVMGWAVNSLGPPAEWLEIRIPQRTSLIRGLVHIFFTISVTRVGRGSNADAPVS